MSFFKKAFGAGSIFKKQAMPNVQGFFKKGGAGSNLEHAPVDFECPIRPVGVNLHVTVALVVQYEPSTNDVGASICTLRSQPHLRSVPLDPFEPSSCTLFIPRFPPSTLSLVSCATP